MSIYKRNSLSHFPSFDLCFWNAFFQIKIDLNQVMKQVCVFKFPSAGNLYVTYGSVLILISCFKGTDVRTCSFLNLK